LVDDNSIHLLLLFAMSMNNFIHKKEE